MFFQNRETVTQENNGRLPAESAYVSPPLSLLDDETLAFGTPDPTETAAISDKLIGIIGGARRRAELIGCARGPRYTRYEILPVKGKKTAVTAALHDRIAVELATVGVRLTNAPNGEALYVYVPNKESTVVHLAPLLDTEEFRKEDNPLLVPLGVDPVGEPFYYDLTRMPHLLIGCATGMGKTVCINSILASILTKASPRDVKLLLIDTKMVEFDVYRGLPHLLAPPVNDVKHAVGALIWARNEMERRFSLLTKTGSRNIDGYHAWARERGEAPLPRILIVIDELSDLMTAAGRYTEDEILRIAAKARAVSQG